jgi:hypothetical protein
MSGRVVPDGGGVEAELEAEAEDELARTAVEPDFRTVVDFLVVVRFGFSSASSRFSTAVIRCSSDSKPLTSFSTRSLA